MKIAVLAAKGRAGSAIVQEAVNAGFEVSAFARSKAQFDERVHLVIKDIFSLTSADLQGFDVIIDAFGEWQDLSLHKKHIEHLIKILQGSKVRLLVVGGAGSLYMDKTHTTRLMDTPEFPKEYMGVAEATAEVLGALRGEQNLHWVYVCPPAAFIADAPKSGAYKIIGEEFETNGKNESQGSYADYASAMIEIAQDSRYDKVRVGVIGL